jgi:hypothetical protein
MRVGADLRTAMSGETLKIVVQRPTPTFYCCSSKMQLSLIISAAADLSTPLPQCFEEYDSGGYRDIQRVDGAGCRNRD